MAGWNIAPKCNFWVGSGTFWEWFSKLSSNLFTQLCNTGFFKKISPVCMQDQCGIIVLVYQEIVWASKWFRPQILTGVKGMLTHNIADEREGREEVHSIHSRGGIIPFLLLSMTISHPPTYPTATVLPFAPLSPFAICPYRPWRKPETWFVCKGTTLTILWGVLC